MLKSRVLMKKVKKMAFFVLFLQVSIDFLSFLQKNTYGYAKCGVP